MIQRCNRIIHSFTPFPGDAPVVLILGSIPGKASLQAQQYYAHPRNAFWQIAADWCGFPVDLPYEEKLTRLNRCGGALWDVIKNCSRDGSLDSAIRNPAPNPLDVFLKAYPDIKTVLFNGKTAEKLFHRYFAGLISPDIELAVLPSTSPANAGTAFAEKRRIWHNAFHKAGLKQQD